VGSGAACRSDAGEEINLSGYAGDVTADSGGRVATNADCEPDHGALLAGRYRLSEPLLWACAEPARERHWRGFDEVLARPVMITVLQTSGHDADELLAAAVANGRVAHPGVASVFDAAIVDGCTYVVSEWVEGTSLTAALRDGPMPPSQAAAVAHAAAEAVAAVHAQGLVHGNLHPDNVVLTTGGGIKLTDLRTNGGGERTADVRCLGALLYAALTGKWPAGIPSSAGTSLPTAPYDDDRLCAPRQVRAGVPGHLSELAMRALDREPVLSAANLAQSLDHHASDSMAAPLPVMEDVPGEREHRAMRRVAIPVAVLLVIAMAGLLLGVRLGAIENPAGYRVLDFGTDATPSPVAVAQPLPISAARIIDPEGDGAELAGAERVRDGDPATAWRTDSYKTARFGNLKRGIGIRLDLGTAQSVRQVAVSVQNIGGVVELRTGAADGDSPDDYRTITPEQNPDSTTITFSIPPTTSRYWLIWYTSLPENDRGYGVGVTEVRFT